MPEERFIVQIVAFKDDEVVKESEPMSERRADHVDDGFAMNLNHEEYYTRIVPVIVPD